MTQQPNKMNINMRGLHPTAQRHLLKKRRRKSNRNNAWKLNSLLYNNCNKKVLGDITNDIEKVKSKKILPLKGMHSS